MIHVSMDSSIIQRRKRRLMRVIIILKVSVSSRYIPLSLVTDVWVYNYVDLEHFARKHSPSRFSISLDIQADDQSVADHAHIEAEEDGRERRFEGLPDDAPLGSDQPITDPLDQYETTDPSSDAQKVFPPRPPGAGSSRPSRIDKSTSAREELHKARAEADGMASYGEDGFYRPRSVSEKMRKGMPYSEWTVS